MEDTILHKYVLTKDPKRKGYFFSPVMVELLHHVANVPLDILRKTKVYSRTPVRYIPFYPAHRGGGAITLGSDTWQSITFTENFFSSDKNLYGNRAYANDLDDWLRLSAHEAGHLNHAVRFKFFIMYLIIFVVQYVRYGHDAAPLEIEADEGTKLKKENKTANGGQGTNIIIKDPLIFMLCVFTFRYETS